MSALEVSTRHCSRKEGASPAENKFYTLIMFDISNQKEVLADYEAVEAL